MKKMTQKLLAILSAATMLGSTLPQALAASTPVTAYEEDFESRTTTELIRGIGSTATNGDWTVSSVHSGSSWADGNGIKYSGSQVLVDTKTDESGNKVLNLYGYGNGFQTALNLNPEKYKGIGSNAKFSASFSTKNWEQKASIRFMVSADEKSYYAVETGTNGQFVDFIKVVNGERVIENHLFWGWGWTTWYDVSISNVGNRIYYSIWSRDKSKGDEGYIEDNEMFAYRGSEAGYQLAQIDNGPTYFDNVKLEGYEFSDISDDFSGYDEKEEMGKGTSVTNGLFTMSKESAGSGWNDNYARSRIAAADGNKALELVGYGSGTYAALNLNPEMYASCGNNVEMKVTKEQTSLPENDSGIRFMVSGDEKSYYALYGSTDSNLILEKVVNGEAVSDWGFISENTYGKCEISLANIGNKIYYSMTDLETGVKESGSVKDAAMFANRGGNAGYQLFRANDGTTRFDNFSFKRSVDFKGYVDSFDDYEVGQWITGPGSSCTNGAWKMSEKENECGQDNGSGTIIETIDGNDKGLRFANAGAWGDGYNSAVYLNPEMYAGIGDDIEMKFSLRIGTCSQSLRFMCSEDGKSGYKLTFGWDAGTGFYKFSEGEAETVMGWKDGFLNVNNRVYDCVIRYNGGRISWSIKDTETEEVWEGNYSDSNPKVLHCSDAVYGFAIQGEAHMTINNFSFKDVKSGFTADTSAEPANIIYVDAGYHRPQYMVGNEKVIDMIDSYQIRRLSAEGMTGEITVYASKNGKAWSELTKLVPGTDGNAKMVQAGVASDYRYVKLAAAGGADIPEVQIAAIPKKGTVRLDSDLKLIAHLDSFDVSEADWASGDEYCLSVENGIVTSVDLTEAPIAITASDMDNTASIFLSVTDNCEFLENADGSLTATLGTLYYEDGASFVAAGYAENGKLLGTQALELAGENQTSLQSFRLNMPEGTKKVRIFCWGNGYQGMKPLFDGAAFAF